ncbi:MAG: Binding-prot-dependent transport system rane comp, N-term, partial [Actinomycetota bacterium]
MDILRLLAKRLVGMVVIVTIATFLLACLVWLLPGDPAALLVAGSGTPEIIAEIRRELHLDKGIIGYWWNWYSNLL